MNDYTEMFEQVKALMIRLGFNVVDKGMPTIKILKGDGWIYGTPIAAYIFNDHVIVIREELKHLEEPTIFDELLAHEMCHSLQGLTAEKGKEVEVFEINDEYWELQHEREAYTVGGLFTMMYRSKDYIEPSLYQSKMQKVEALINDGMIDVLVGQFVSYYKRVYAEQKLIV